MARVKFLANGTENEVDVSAANPLPVTGSVTGTVTMASVGLTGATAPTSADEIGWIDGTGKLQPVAAATPLPENVAQINGVTPLMGAGATGTGAQRVTVAQDATTIAGSAPGTAGSASANVLSVQGIAGGTALPVSGTVTTQAARSSTGTQSSVASANTSGTILAANANRLGATVVNDSTQILYLLLSTGGTASATAYTVALPPAGSVGAYYEVPFGYTGAIIGIWAAANGNARVTEFAA